ncbi:MAG: hypothetical protein AAF585_12910 [Verrucomicrobiota bacterium]
MRIARQLSFFGRSVRGVKLSPDGRLLQLLDGGRPRIFEATTLDEVTPGPEPRG